VGRLQGESQTQHLVEVVVPNQLGLAIQHLRRRYAVRRILSKCLPGEYRAGDRQTDQRHH